LNLNRFKVLNTVPECDAMKDDFIVTLKSARDLAMALLKQECADFPKQQSWKTSRVLMRSKHYQTLIVP